MVRLDMFDHTAEAEVTASNSNSHWPLLLYSCGKSDDVDDGSSFGFVKRMTKRIFFFVRSQLLHNVGSSVSIHSTNHTGVGIIFELIAIGIVLFLRRSFIQ